MITVTVRYFVTLREQRGRDHETVECEDNTSIGDLYLSLFPPGPSGSLPVGYARNLESVDAETPLTQGDEVAFLPPLGGG